MNSLIVYWTGMAGWQFTVRESRIENAQVVLGDEEIAAGAGFDSQSQALQAGRAELSALREQATT